MSYFFQETAVQAVTCVIFDSATLNMILVHMHVQARQYFRRESNVHAITCSKWVSRRFYQKDAIYRKGTLMALTSHTLLQAQTGAASLPSGKKIKKNKKDLSDNVNTEILFTNCPNTTFVYMILCISYIYFISATPSNVEGVADINIF